MKKIIIAITGPSGVGKNTLGSKLVERDNFVTPVHNTTRLPRPDDEIGFYRYVSHEEFKNETVLNNFLFWSGDNSIVDKKYGNYYGILNNDYSIISYNDRIIFFISYKDIDTIFYLKQIGYNIEIVNLLYFDIEKSMEQRLSIDARNHSVKDIEKRIECAKNYEQLFRKKLDDYDILKIYTDLCDSEETYNIVKKKKLSER